MPSTPRPSSISVCSAREITSRLASSIAFGAYRFEKALAHRVEQVRALAATALGDEHARRRQRRRVELHHLHVLQRYADVQRLSHPVAGARVRVRRPDVEPARPARREDRRLRADRLEAAVEQVPADDALASAVVLDQPPGEVLLVDEDVALHQLLVEHLHEHMARDVGRVRRARRARCTERPLRDPAVLRAENTAPQFSSW